MVTRRAFFELVSAGFVAAVLPTPDRDAIRFVRAYDVTLEHASRVDYVLTMPVLRPEFVDRITSE